MFKKISYFATYRDKVGEEKTQLWNDGTNLTMEIRGVKFTRQFLDDFEPVENTPPEIL